jgi:hypothetical protein
VLIFAPADARTGLEASAVDWNLSRPVRRDLAHEHRPALFLGLCAVERWHGALAISRRAAAAEHAAKEPPR